jgi:hypothetical protein
MSKLDIGVGDEFPLDEGEPAPGGRHAWKQEFRAHRRAMRTRRHDHHHGRHGMHGHHHRHHGFGRLSFLLVIAGLVALIVNHQLTAPIAYGMIGTGIALLALMFLVHAIWHRRHHRGMHNPPQQVA